MDFCGINTKNEPLDIGFRLHAVNSESAASGIARTAGIKR